jgi:hypothetical protein
MGDIDSRIQAHSASRLAEADTSRTFRMESTGSQFQLPVVP